MAFMMPGRLTRLHLSAWSDHEGSFQIRGLPNSDALEIVVSSEGLKSSRIRISRDRLTEARIHLVRL
jgi:hypothetical protein